MRVWGGIAGVRSGVAGVWGEKGGVGWWWMGLRQETYVGIDTSPTDSKSAKLLLLSVLLYKNVYKKNYIFKLKKSSLFLQNSKNVAQILISCFAELRKFRPNFDFVFREISRNSGKISQNTKLKFSRKFREIAKTKIFAATVNQT